MKTLETRNHTHTRARRSCCTSGSELTRTEAWHREILARDVVDEAEIDRVTSLPSGFSRGQAVAVVRVGKTELIADERDRCAPEVEAGACATGQAMGRYVTRSRTRDGWAGACRCVGSPGCLRRGCRASV